MSGDSPRVFWHKDLPPLAAVIEGEHVVEAQSPKVVLHAVTDDDKWQACRDPLMEVASRRLLQELERLGGWCAHVVDEHIVSRTNQATGEYWLDGRFTYIMYRHPEA